MKYCSKCGKELMDEAVICVGCGCPVSNNVENKNTDKPEIPSLITAAIVLGFLMPIVGLILGIVGAVKYSETEIHKKAIGAILISIGSWIFWFFILSMML